MTVALSRRGMIRVIAGLIALAMSFYHMWVVAFGAPEPVIFRATHLLFAMLLVFLWYRISGTTSEEPSLIDYLLLAASAASVGYQLVAYEYITVGRMYYVDDLRPIDWVLSITLIVALLEATRRTIGPALTITALVFIAYALLIARVEPQRFLDQAYLTTEGIFGIPLSVSASYVMIFVLFGSFMERTGTGQLFMDFALSLTGHTAGGPGKVSVVSSSLFGTISGSAVANVMVDGPISIPLMKRSGFRAHFAAGVEAVASTGGQIMPPIMGAAAFVMAEFLRVGYVQVIVWALIPSILYYVACFYAVHFEAKRQGIVGLPRAELPQLGQTLRERGHLFIPVLTILMIMYSGYSAPMAALGGTLICFPAAWFGPCVLFVLPLLILAPHALPKTFPALVPTFSASGLIEAAILIALISLWTYRTWGRIVLLPIQGWPIIDAMIDAAKNGLGVAMACATAGVIIGIITLTGIGLTFTQFVVGLAQNTLLLALVLTMMAGIVLGMGMPTTPAYIIMTSLLVPAIIKLGVAEPAAHMFAFYFAILSAITPPVALAVFAAAGLAKADLWKSGWAAVKIGAAGFIVPFMFVYEPALLMYDPLVKSKDLITAGWLDIARATATASIGIVLLAASLHGFIWGKLDWWQRAIAFAGAGCLVLPTLATDIAGLGAAATILVSQRMLGRSGKDRPATPPAPASDATGAAPSLRGATLPGGPMS